MNLDFYCPLHILGTGNPLSIISYTMAGADSFDGLEWCQTVVDHDTGKLFHFQQWDLFRYQTEYGKDDTLCYVFAVLMHNLKFFRNFMHGLHESIVAEADVDFLKMYTSDEHAMLLLNAINEYE